MMTAAAVHSCATFSLLRRLWHCSSIATEHSRLGSMVPWPRGLACPLRRARRARVVMITELTACSGKRRLYLSLFAKFETGSRKCERNEHQIGTKKRGREASEESCKVAKRYYVMLMRWQAPASRRRWPVCCGEANASACAPPQTGSGSIRILTLAGLRPLGQVLVQLKMVWQLRAICW